MSDKDVYIRLISRERNYRIFYLQNQNIYTEKFL